MFPSDLKYTKNHEYLKPLGDGTALVGISSYAQEALGDVVHRAHQLEPEAGTDNPREQFRKPRAGPLHADRDHP